MIFEDKMLLKPLNRNNGTHAKKGNPPPALPQAPSSPLRLTVWNDLTRGPRPRAHTDKVVLKHAPPPLQVRHGPVGPATRLGAHNNPSQGRKRGWQASTARRLALYLRTSTVH